MSTDDVRVMSEYMIETTRQLSGQEVADMRAHWRKAYGDAVPIPMVLPPGVRVVRVNDAQGEWARRLATLLNAIEDDGHRVELETDGCHPAIMIHGSDPNRVGLRTLRLDETGPNDAWIAHV